MYAPARVYGCVLYRQKVRDVKVNHKTRHCGGLRSNSYNLMKGGLI